MASRAQMIAVLLAIAITGLPFAMAADFIVGDHYSWMPDFNYTVWAEGKEFRVGDYLVFIYPEGFHNVVQVGGADFRACNATGSTAVYSSGFDVLPLEAPGKMWFICGVADHCVRGQKLVINVLAAAAIISIPPAASPTSSSPASPLPAPAASSPASLAAPSTSPAPASLSPPLPSPYATPAASPPASPFDHNSQLTHM